MKEIGKVIAQIILSVCLVGILFIAYLCVAEIAGCKGH